MDQDMKGWFTERSPMWPGEAFSLKVKQTLFKKRSQFQNIEIIESTNHGKVLILDGVIQFTEKDEASYQEMITFLPLNAHPNPTKVLVIGGGDGGVARELAKHPLVKEVVQCEIDAEVVEACKAHVPSMGSGFSNPKLTLYTGDGAKFLEETADKFDVIITDASDPVVNNTDQDDDDDDETGKDGPAVSLFNEDYYTKMKTKLTDGGILCCQGENMWLYSDLIAKLIKGCRQSFPVVEYAFSPVPTYPMGQIGFILCSKNQATRFKEPIHVWDQKKATEMGLRYYNADVHRAAFALPTFMHNTLTHSLTD